MLPYQDTSCQDQYVPTSKYTYTLTSPFWKTHSRIDHVFIDRKWHSSVLNILSARGADCDTDHYMVVTKLKGRKQAEEVSELGAEENIWDSCTVGS
jgi:hypothetical protein